MKLIFMLITAMFLHASAKTYSQNVTLKMSKASLEDVFQQIQAQTKYDFLYNIEDLALAKPVDISFKNLSLKDALDICFQNQSLLYSINNTTILITRKATPSLQVNGTISGKVTDEQGQPLPGAGIKIAALNKGVSTDANGNYSISVPEGTYKMEVTFVSYERKIATVMVKGNKTTSQNIVLAEAKTELSEIVVTALGIKREEKALGYSQTTVKNEQLTEAVSNNWTDALSGKVAGVNLVRSGSGPAGSNSIVLRGESNLTGSNDALVVVDGVVINNGSGKLVGSGSKAYLDTDSPTDFGSGLNDINPEDIESVSVLKGPGAAALYGQRGANGAIIITTKSGKIAKGIGISVNSNTAIEIATGWPDWQYEYGQGSDNMIKYYSYSASADGPGMGGTGSAWGPKFEGQMFFQYDPATQQIGTERTPWVPYPETVREFFQAGVTTTNGVSLEGGNANTSVRLSATNLYNSWIVPNTGYKRNTIALSLNHKVTSKLQVAAKINYTNKNSGNLPSTGFNNQSVMYWAGFMTPNSPLSWIKDYWKIGKEGVVPHYPFSANPDNPYLIVNEMLNKQNRNGITGNLSLNYDITKSLNLMLRTSLDFANDERSQQKPFGTNKFPEGTYRTTNLLSQELNNDFLLRYTVPEIKNFKMTFSIGGSSLSNRFIMDELRAEQLLYPQIYSLGNSKSNVLAVPNRSRYKINSLYGLATFSFKDYLFLDLTGRNDWNSVLATPTGTDNVSFFYPSVNLSAVISDMFELPAAFSFAKLRGSYAGVGSGSTTPYQTSVSYNVATGYPGGLVNSTVLANLDLKPLFTTSYEAGADIRLFKSRLGLDIALYKGKTRDQILAAEVDRSTGVKQITVNAGEVQNSGVEVQINGKPIVNQKGFSWNTFVTFSANENEVLTLGNSGLPQLQLQTGPNSGSAVVARVGGNIGSLYGIGYQRSPEGEIIFENGIPLRTPEMIYLGNTTPKWKASFGNDFSYKRFNLKFLFDGQYGGVGYSLTHGIHMTQGKIKETLPGRDEGIIGKGVIKNPDGTYRPNDVKTTAIPTYYQALAARENAEGNTFSTNFIKLREARLDYSFNTALLGKLRVQKATIGIYGRNLLTFTDWPQYDPEFGTTENGNINKGIEVGQFPNTRTIGMNLTVLF